LPQRVRPAAPRACASASHTAAASARGVAEAQADQRGEGVSAGPPGSGGGSSPVGGWQSLRRGVHRVDQPSTARARSQTFECGRLRGVFCGSTGPPTGACWTACGSRARCRTAASIRSVSIRMPRAYSSTVRAGATAARAPRRRAGRARPAQRQVEPHLVHRRRAPRRTARCSPGPAPPAARAAAAGRPQTDHLAGQWPSACQADVKKAPEI
jgi:hypothetical protein